MPYDMEESINSRFMDAVISGNVERTNTLINSYGLYRTEGRGYVLVREAVKSKKKNVVELLICKGARVNSTNPCVSQPLHFAVYNGDIEIASMLLDKRANINAKNGEGKTVLHEAIKKKKRRMVDLFLKHGADVNAKDHVGKTPLYFATQGKSKELVILLLNNGANVNIKTNDNITPLHVAAQNGDEDIAEELLKYEAFIQSITLREGYSPLHYAVQQPNIDIVKLLLDKGADINACTTKGDTPLHCALQRSDTKHAELLLQLGANTHIQNAEGQCALYFAVKHGDLNLVKKVLLLKPDINNQSNKNCLKLAIKQFNPNATIANILLEYGFGVLPEDANDNDYLESAIKIGCLRIVQDLLEYSATDKNYNELLKIAVDAGKIEIFEAILKCIPDINAKGLTALYSVCRSSSSHLEKFVKILLDKGANVNTQTNEGYTALYGAIEDYNDSVVKILLEHKANVNLTKYIFTYGDRFTALLIAALQGNARIVLLLLDYGADINAKSDKGLDALYIAVEHRHVNVVQILLSYGANIDTKYEDDNTILHLSNHMEITEMLIKYGANMNCINKMGFTPWDMSIAKRNEAVCNCLLMFGCDMDIRKLQYSLQFLENYMYQEMYSNVDQIMTHCKLKHLIKMKAANLWMHIYVDEIFTEDHVLHILKTESSLEIAIMKNENICNTSVSFYHILVMRTGSLAILLRNEHIAKVLSSDYVQKFPIYNKMLQGQYLRAKRWKKLIDQNCAVFNVFDNHIIKLPHELIEKVFTYLDENDLSIVVDACQPMNSSANICI